VKTLESKETGASKKITITHNSVFAAHRLQCRMTIRKIDIRHFGLATRCPPRSRYLPGKYLCDKTRDGFSHFGWGVFLQKVCALYCNLLLIWPRATELWLRANQESAWIPVNEQLRSRTASQHIPTQSEARERPNGIR